MKKLLCRNRRWVPSEFGQWRFFPKMGKLNGRRTVRNGAAVPQGSRFDVETRVTNNLRAKQLSDARIAKVENLEAFARDHGHTIVELAISWLTSQPIVGSVIAGATRPEQIRANAAAACWDLASEDFEAVAAILAD